MHELKYNTRVGSNEPGSVMWQVTRQFKTHYSQFELSHWNINYSLTTEYVILKQNQYSIFIFNQFHD